VAKKPNVTLHAVALSDHEGSGTLNIPVDAAGVEHDASASVDKSGSGEFRERVVPLATLDSFQFCQVALIKIDVEGHELRVVEGAQKTIASDKPALLIEIEERHNSRPINEVFKRVTDFGYEGFFMSHGHLRSLSEFDVSAHQILENLGRKGRVYINNFLFLHHSRLARGEYKRLPGLSSLK
jgi:hypothetical protein